MADFRVDIYFPIINLYMQILIDIAPISRREMTNNIPASADFLEPVECISYRLRRAARTAAKFYDNALRPSGLRNTQFTLLVSLDDLGETSIGDLSEKLAIDGTTLTRNLEVLVRRGLVENIEADDARIRKVRLTGLGKETYEAAAPLWREAQNHVLGVVEPECWKGMRTQLRQIETACNRPG